MEFKCYFETLGGHGSPPLQGNVSCLAIFLYAIMSKRIIMLSKETILQYLKEYKALKKDSYSILKIGIFGSYARDEANENSDIDIVVDFEKADLFNQIGIMQELEEKFNKHVDVIALWKHMNPKLLSRIQRDAIYV